MSLPRVSYLESWEPSPASLRRPQDRDQSPGHESDGDNDSYQDLPDSSLSSSFPSAADIPSLRHRLNFNPYAGPGWTQAVVDGGDDDRNPISRVSSLASKQGKANHAAVAEQQAVQQAELDQDAWGPLETTGAFEVGTIKRVSQVVVAVVYCFFAAGVVFGFAAIKPVFISEGVYGDSCSGGESACYGQELRLNLMFTIAAVATNVSALPVGTILDTYGPRVCGIIGSGCLFLGALLLALANRLPFDAYVLGYLLLALGGPFIFISSFQLSNTFPTRSGLILSSLTGAFDASSALFLIFRIVYDKTHGSFSSQKFFSVYLVIPLLILIAQITIMPNTSYKTAGELVQQAEDHIAAEASDRVDDHIFDRDEGERQRNDRRMHRQSVVSKIQDLLTDGDETASVISDLGLTLNDGHDVAESSASRAQPEPSLPNKHTSGGVWGAMHGFSAVQQIRSTWFVLIAFFTVLQMLRINYFVASIRQQYEYLFDSVEDARHLNEIFDFLLPLGGLCAVPFIGTILDSASTPFVLLVLASTATAIGILGCIPDSRRAAYANIILFVVYRPFYYTAVSDYAAKVFGFHTFGKVYGLIICVAGLGNFAQAGLDALTFTVFDRNPIPVNLILTILTCVTGAALVGFVWRKSALMTEYGPPVTSNPNDPEIAVLVQDYDGVATRDWEQQPLLEPRSIPSRRQGESLSYGSLRSP
ncbi:major facilitator superfamily domain-containing protein [Aspergillus pseudoustus]|uniref:Major facilitator superfamily domain-containing protein n=1 Tax=Aspergillus pseudoustus TaxID=1810923 RepID=A0ABR4JNU6_9EURO